MNTVDWIVLIILAAVLLGVIFYIRKAKKNGAKCIGCPERGNCSGCCGKSE